MASNEIDPNFVTEINGKPVDASGSYYLYVDTESFQGPIHIEKVFGIVSKETNIVLKFRLIASDTAWKGTGYCILLLLALSTKGPSLGKKWHEDHAISYEPLSSKAL